MKITVSNKKYRSQHTTTDTNTMTQEAYNAISDAEALFRLTTDELSDLWGRCLSWDEDALRSRKELIHEYVCDFHHIQNTVALIIEVQEKALDMLTSRHE